MCAGFRNPASGRRSVTPTDPLRFPIPRTVGDPSLHQAPVAQRAAELDIKHVYQGQERKLSAFLDLLERTGVDPGQTCFAGDDWIDLPVMIRAGLAVAVADAEARVKAQAHWITQNKGGKGAVREICNLILAAQDKEQAVLDAILAS